MPSLAEQSIMLEALSGDSDRDMPRGMKAMRGEAAADPDKWKWAKDEAARRTSENPHD